MNLRLRAFFAASCVLAMTTNASAAEFEGDSPAPERERASSALPLRYVERPLTLPRGTLAPQFTLADAHFETGIRGNTFAANAIGMDLGAAYGVTDNLTVDVTPLTLLLLRADTGSLSQTNTYYGTFRLGGTYRFLHGDVADAGARFEFGANGTTDTIHMTGSVPLLLRLGRSLRVDTGLAFTVLVPTKGGQADIGIASVGSTLPLFTTVSGNAGIPIEATVQIVDAFYAGLDTGLGVASFRSDVAKSCFMPLGFRAGYTFGGANPVADVSLGFRFPFFLLGADASPPLTEYWNVGLAAKVFLPL